jgi:DnaK suppressor protein
MSESMPDHYRPTEDEPFMNPKQLEYFRQRLLSWREQLLKESSDTIIHLQTDPQAEADIVDCAANETDRAIELRARDRERKLINKIEEALRRIEEGTYGFCEETGDPIGVKRLEARPIATLSLEAQERHERLERLQKDY